jgi:hypothetical protein
MDLPLDPRFVGWKDQSKPPDLHEEVRFAPDSMLEGAGFEPSVPRPELGAADGRSYAAGVAAAVDPKIMRALACPRRRCRGR